MKNVLYIGPYYSDNDHGYTSRYIIRQLAATKCNLITRPIYLHQNNINTEEFLPFEKTAPHFDIIIQDVPPHKLDYEGGVKNIAIVRFNTIDRTNSTALSRLKIMDEVWCLSKEDESNLIASNFDVKKLKCYFPKFIKREIQNPVQVNNQSDSFVFGWVGGPTDIDDLDSFLTAFHTEFHYTEPVCLVLNVLNVDRTTAKINEIKTKLRLYRDIGQYKREIITTFDFGNISRLIPAIHCLVRTVRGETFNRFHRDFYLTGKPVLCLTDYGHPIKYQYIPCICGDCPLMDLFSARELWKQVDVCDLMSHMRTEYLLYKTSKNTTNYYQPRSIDDLNKDLLEIEL